MSRKKSAKPQSGQPNRRLDCEKSNQVILIVVAHPDDETLGCGGTIARHVQNGDRVYAVAMTDGVSSRKTSPIAKRARQTSAMKASVILGFTWIEARTFKDNQMDTVALLHVVKVLETIKSKIKPTLVYTHAAADLNIDHQVLAQAVLTAFRPQPKETCKEIRAFEVPSATDYGHPSVTSIFKPNLYIDISSTWDKKYDALSAYGQELRDSPHTRSHDGIRLLALIRGYQVGLPMAEAFEVLRRIE